MKGSEKNRAVALMRRVEEFSGVVVLAYAFMSNHFHIFIYVPSAEEIGEGEILRRIRALYRDASLSQVVATWNRLKTEEQELFKRARPTKKYVSRFEAYKSSFLRRMWNSAEFMRTFKQHFTMSFNGRREHSGTMFEGRYRERNRAYDRHVHVPHVVEHAGIVPDFAQRPGELLQKRLVSGLCRAFDCVHPEGYGRVVDVFSAAVRLPSLVSCGIVARRVG